MGPAIQQELKNAVDRTRSNTGLRFNVALNYSGRAEIIHAVNTILAQAKQNPALLDGIKEEDLARRLYTAGLPDPDLLIRTSGELRISNFLLWQIAYSEIWITGYALGPIFDGSIYTKPLLHFRNANADMAD